MPANNNRIEFQLDFKTGDIKALSSLKKDLAEIQRMAADPDFTAGFSTKEIQNMITAARTLDSALDQAFDVNLNTVNVQKFNSILAQSGYNAQTLQAGLSQAGVLGQQAFLKLTGQLMQFNTATKQTNKFLDGIATSLFNTIKWSAMSSIVNNVAATVQKSYYYVKDLDRSLNDIRIVTNKSAEDMGVFAEKANEAAKALAVTTEDYTQGSLIYYQQGLDDATVETLTDITAKTSNVTQQSMSTVSEQLTAVWNGYQVANRAAEEGMQVYEEYVDKMAAVGASTASDLEELSTAMSKVASAASSMGVDFDDLNAQIATIVSVTRQAPESVGTALKTIYARLGDLKVDGVDEFGTKLGEVSAQLQTMGINIIDQQGNMRNMSDVIAEVAEKWDTWTSAQRQAAAVAMAGKRQYNNLIALFDNQDMYGEALETSMNAAGTLEKQQEIAMDSLANKMDVLKATAEDLYDSLFNTDTISDFLDTGTGVLQFFADFADSIGGLNTLLPMLGSIGLQVFSDQIGRGLATIVINARNARAELDMMKSNQAALQSMFTNSTFVGLDPEANVHLKEMLGYYQEMSQYQSVMSQEQKEQYKNILETKEAAGSLSVEVGHQKERQEQTYKSITAIKLAENEHLDSTEKIQNRIEIIKNIIKELDDNLEAGNLTAENFASIFSKRVQKDIGLSNEAVKNLVAHLKSAYKVTGDENAALQQVRDKLQEASDQLVNITAQENKIKSLDNSFKSLGSSLKDNVSTQAFISNITSAVGAFGQLAMSIQTLKNLGNIQNNEDISDGEKLLQIIMNLSFAAGPLVNSLNTLGGSLLGLSNARALEMATNSASIKVDEAKIAATSAQEARELAEAKSLALATAERERAILVQEHENTSIVQGATRLKLKSDIATKDIQIEELRVKATAANIAAEKAEKAAQDADTASTIANNSVKAQQILNSKGNVIAKLKELQAIKTNTIAVNEETAALVANKIAKLGVIGAVGLLAVGVYAAVKAYDAFTISAEEAAEALDKTLEIYKGTEDELKSLENELDQVREKIQKLTEQDSLTLVEKQELAKLESTNSLLEAQIASKKELLRLQQREAVADAKQAASKGSYDVDGTNKIQNIVQDTQRIEYAGENNKYSLDRLDYSNLVEFQTAVQEKLSVALEDATNKTLDDNTRSVAQAAVNYYSELLNDKQPEIEKDQSEKVTSMQEGYQKALEVLPILYESNTDITGKYDDNNVESDTIKYYEEKVLQYYQSTGALQNILKNTAKSVFETDVELQKFLNDFGKYADSESKEINERILTEILGEDKFNELQIRAQTLGISLYDLIDKTKEYGIKIAQEAEEITNIVIRDLTNLNEALSALYEGKDLSDDQIVELEKLENKYVELGEAYNVFGRQAKEYIEILGQVQESEEKLRQEELKENFENTKEKYLNYKEYDDKGYEINISVNPESMDRVTEQISSLFDQKYEIEVAVTDDLLTDVDSIAEKAENAADAIRKIGEGFEVAYEDADELFAVFPELAQEARVLADGTIQLNQEVTESILGNYGNQIDADKQKTVNEINNRIEILKAEKEKAEESLKLVQNENITEQELDDITKDCCIDNTEDIVNSNKEMTDIAIANSGFLAEEVINNQKEMAAAATQYGQIAADAIAGKVPTGTVTAGANISYSGATKSADSMSDFSQNPDEAIEKRRKVVEEALKKQIESYERQIADLMIGGSKILSKNADIGQAAIDSLEKDKSKSGGSSKDKSKEGKEQEDEFDRYQEIKKAIDAVDQALKKLDKDQENLFGYELIASLKQENELLEQQAANYNTLYEMQQQEAAELREQLGTMGLMFDASGAITNYAAATSAALQAYAAAIEQYNAGLIDETTLKVYEKSYENFKKLLQRYDTLYYKEMQDTQDKIDEIHRKELANNLKAWETEIQIHLDMEKAKRDQNEFLKDITKDFRKVYQDLTIDVNYDEDNFKSIVNDVNTTIRAIHDVQSEIDKMMSGGTSDMFESVSQAQEKLKKLQEELLSQGKDLYALYKAVWEAYLEGMDQVKDQFDELMNKYKHFDNELKFQKELIELLYGDKAYELMDKYYKVQEQNVLAQIESLRKQTAMWESEFQKSYQNAIKNGSKVDIDDFTTWTEDMKKAYENMIESQEDLNDLILEAVKILQDQYLNSINKIMDAMDKEIWGKDGFEGMKKNQEFMQKMADEYLDAVEGGAKIQLFANRIDMDKANTSNLKAQQKLQAFRDKEIKDLREKENLTQADIDLAEARYQIMLKEIALEDAQNNKTSMKLTRNEQGNQSYQYVADEDEVGQKQQDLLQSYSDLYKLADDSFAHSMELAFDLYEEVRDRIREIAEDTTLTEEEKNQKIAEIQKQYSEQINIALGNAELYRQEAMQATAGVFQTICEQDASAYESLTEEQKRMVDELKELHFEDYNEMRDHLKEDFLPSVKEVFEEMNINSQTTAAQFLKDQVKDPNSVKNSMIKAVSEIQKAIQEYEKELDKLQQIADMDFSKIGESIDKVSKKIEDMGGTTDRMVDNSSQYLDELRRTLETVASTWDSVIEKILESQRAMQEYINLAAQARAASGAAPSPGGSSGGTIPGANGPGNGGNDGGNNPTNPLPNNKGNENRNYYVKIPQYDNRGFRLNTDKTINDLTLEEAQALAKQYGGTVCHYDTGGYTGVQNNGDSDGRLAMLHQKELVLNADDTENFLSGISMIRDMTSMNGSISKAITNAVGNMVYALNNTSIGVKTSPAAQEAAAYNTYNITAEFPNANDVNEIREAILSLPNLASQYIGRNIK